MRLHRCANIGCRELIPLKHSYCQAHYNDRLDNYMAQRAKNKARASQTLRGKRDLAEQNRKYDQTRRKELHDGFYQSKQWTRIAEYVKQRDSYIDAIEGKTWDKGDLIADHIIPRRLLPGVEQYNTDNLWLLTKAQHNLKTSIEKKLSDQQLKHVGRDWWKKILQNKKISPPPSC